MAKRWLRFDFGNIAGIGAKIRKIITSTTVDEMIGQSEKELLLARNGLQQIISRFKSLRTPDDSLQTKFAQREEAVERRRRQVRHAGAHRAGSGLDDVTAVRKRPDRALVAPSQMAKHR